MDFVFIKIGLPENGKYLKNKFSPCMVFTKISLNIKKNIYIQYYSIQLYFMALNFLSTM